MLYNPRAVFGVNHNRVFCADALFIRAENTVGARSAQWRLVDAGGQNKIRRTAALTLARTAPRPRGSPIARGPKAVRTQSAILYKNKAKPLLLLTVTARSAQIRAWHATMIKTPYMIRTRRKPTSP
jgi:hypothetical protein